MTKKLYVVKLPDGYLAVKDGKPVVAISLIGAAPMGYGAAEQYAIRFGGEAVAISEPAKPKAAKPLAVRLAESFAAQYAVAA